MRVPTTAFDRVLDQLTAAGKQVHRRGNDQASAQCPAHDDANPSLSLTRRPEDTLVHCHAGCPTPDVMAALDLTMRDLYDHPKADYRYQGGRVVHRAYDSTTGRKRFRQTGNTDDTSLYRVERLDGHRKGNPVYVVEGGEGRARDGTGRGSCGLLGDGRGEGPPVRLDPPRRAHRHRDRGQGRTGT